MSPSYDFVNDNLEHMESQGFQYFLVLVDKDKDSKNDKIIIYTTFEEDELDKLIKTIRESKNKETKPRKPKSKKKGSSPDIQDSR